MSINWLAIGVLAFLTVILLIITILLYRKMKKFQASYISLQTFMDGQQMDILLDKYIQKVTDLEQNLEKCKERLDPIEIKLRASIDRAEIQRFRAFEDVGSDLSFAVAFLNQEGDGLVLSSIHSREEARIYAKPISGGQSQYSLSDEERDVVLKAMNGKKI
ncbi:DUF4446 family protein [Desulfosporosinus meridiei]|uniref:DUF4446 domain-containing protein n=1 Tax=Desulfosporosinus meridiei (strain ATCC BAA-275 / DSM 13257 / KCTC 12902 / NCIMB 13706 / S10) TaxID=768704 RepID=J7J698_DESMD|nr:DUF4446 family protein [Desulfosporosinus meridiei]AFQ46451.1 hypothetical protein Desmer_4655 [Desulfosporosinus meridiei DSM 13257]